jgi:hypothetical protein
MSQPRLSNHPKFPVTCEIHGRRPFGYTACLDILKGFSPVAVYIAPSYTRLGQILCDKRHSLDSDGAMEVVLICDLCAKEKGLTKVGARLPTGAK